MILVLAGRTAYGENVLDVYGLAVDHDPQFKGASYERLALKESLKQAYGHMMPDVSLEGVGTRTYQDIVQTSNPVFSAGKIYYNTGLYTAKLVQPIFRYSLFVEIGQAKKLSQRADVDLEIAKQDLIIRVAQVYLSALASGENIEFEKAEKKDVEVFFERAKTRYGAGMAPVTDTYDAQARIDRREARLGVVSVGNRRHARSIAGLCPPEEYLHVFLFRLLKLYVFTRREGRQVGLGHPYDQVLLCDLKVHVGPLRQLFRLRHLDEQGVPENRLDKFCGV